MLFILTAAMFGSVHDWLTFRITYELQRGKGPVEIAEVLGITVEEVLVRIDEL